MLEGKRLCGITAALCGAACLSAALIFFLMKYHSAVSNGASEDAGIYFFSFIGFLVLCAAALLGCLFFSSPVVRWICYVAGCYAVVQCVYVVDDFFTINLCVYSACIVTAALVFSYPANLMAAAGSAAVFICFLFHPSFMGAAPPGMNLVSPRSFEVFLLVFYMAGIIAVSGAIRFFVYEYAEARAAIQHLKLVGSKLTLFNHRLQTLVKNRSEEVVKQDRLRFTRNIHDVCGYAFTNIIAITDGAVSCGLMEGLNAQDIFQRIRNQAAKGLRETRSILHLIREIEDPCMKSIDTIYQMKAIFEETTGVQVAIEWGNIKHNYGATVNEALTRIVQEAFTNAIRHGEATLVEIRFWEFPGTEGLPGKLTMTVTDNGKGAQAVVKGIGLAGMEERLASLGGSLVCSMPEDGGFRLSVIIPLIALEPLHYSPERY